MQKILIATPYYPPQGGGLERYAEAMATRLVKLGWQVVLVTSADQATKTPVDQDGVVVHRLPVAMRVSNTPFSFGWRRQVKKIIAQENPSIINVHLPVSGLPDIVASCAKDIPVVVTVHAGSMRKGKLMPDIVVDAYEKLMLPRLLGRADSIIATSNFIRGTWLKKYSDKTTVITPGFDPKIFYPATKQTKNTLVFSAGLGAAERYKGLDTLLDALTKVNDAQLIIIGDGDDRPRYESRVTDLGLQDRITFKGRLAAPEVADALRSSTALVLPTSNDNFPMVIVEAMACGLPVISTNVGAISDLIVEGETGYICKPTDSDDFVRAIKTILSDPEKSKQMGERGSEIVTSLEWDSATDLLSNLFTARIAASSQPNIVQLAAYYPPHLGGLERVAEEVSQQLAKDDYTVTVLTSNIGAKQSPRVEQSTNLTIKRLRSFEFAHTAFIPGLFWQLWRQPKPVIFHLHLAQAFVPETMWVVAKLRRIPYVVHFHLDVEPSGTFGFIFVAYKKLVQPIIMRGAARIIALSGDQKSMLERVYNMPADSVVYMPNGVSQAFLDLGTQARTAQNPLRILFVGRLASQKRIDRLLEAIALVKVPVAVRLVGDGEDKEVLQAQAKKLKLSNVKFVGSLRGDDLMQVYADADLFILTSDKEGMSLAMLEAMAAGLPMLGSDVPGLAEHLQGVGIVVEPTPEAFAKAIEDIAGDKKLLQKLGKQSYIFAEAYSWPILVKQIEQNYAEVTA